MGGEEISNFMPKKEIEIEKTGENYLRHRIFLLLGIGVCQFLDQIKVTT